MNGLFIGLSTVDLIYYVEKTVSIDEKINARELLVSGGGPATNAAITFSILGNKSRLITGIGSSPFSSYLRKELNDYHIDYVDGFGLSGQMHPISSIQVTPDGSRTVVTNSKAQSLMPEQQLIIPDSTHIVLVDGHYIEEAIRLTRLARQNKIPTVLDGGSWKNRMEELLPWIDVIICSDAFEIPFIEKEYSKINEFLHRSGPRKVAFTRGVQTIIAFENNIRTEITVPTYPVIDTLGAGDIFHGAFCYFYLQNFNFVTSLRHASEIASFSCKYKGTRNWIHPLIHGTGY